MTATTTQEVSQAPTTTPKFSLTEEFGEGRYSSCMKELYNDSKRLLGLGHTQAVKLAHSFGVELGRHNAKSEIKFGKATKEGKMTLRESATIKGVTVTYTISMAKLCVMIQELRTYGVVESEVVLREDFIDFLNK